MTWRSLAKKSEFQEVYGKGAKKVGRLLVVYLLPADDLARAVVASRKVGGAVQRNRAKRLLREAFRAVTLNGLLPGAPTNEIGDISTRKRYFSDIVGDHPEKNADTGLWVVLVARQRILGANSRQVAAELTDLLQMTD